MPMSLDRREFVAGISGAAGFALGWPGLREIPALGQGPALRLPLAQWPLRRALRSGALDHLDFPKVARTEFGLDAVEYVNQFFKDKATDAAYLGEMNRRAGGAGVLQHLVMGEE